MKAILLLVWLILCSCSYSNEQSLDQNWDCTQTSKDDSLILKEILTLCKLGTNNQRDRHVCYEMVYKDFCKQKDLKK